MRCWLPMIASIGVWLTVGAFMVRARGNGYTLYRLDWDGDGFCGVNGTQYTSAADAPALVRDPSAGNLTQGPPIPSGGFNHFGCTGGVPAGFVASRMLGDIGIVAVLFYLLIIEVSGRYGGRILSSFLAFVLVLFTVIKLGAREGLREPPHPPGLPAPALTLTSTLTLTPTLTQARGRPSRTRSPRAPTTAATSARTSSSTPPRRAPLTISGASARARPTRAPSRAKPSGWC
jgi:hypothetical protein